MHVIVKQTHVIVWAENNLMEFSEKKRKTIKQMSHVASKEPGWWAAGQGALDLEAVGSNPRYSEFFSGGFIFHSETSQHDIVPSVKNHYHVSLWVRHVRYC